jgi:hypothetical protein
MPIRAQLALLLACNEGLLDVLPEDRLANAEQRLRAAVADSTLTLQDSREAWLAAIRGWLAELTRGATPARPAAGAGAQGVAQEPTPESAPALGPEPTASAAAGEHAAHRERGHEPPA